jgi:hypothetical protein
MANNIIEDFIKDKKLQQTINIQIIGQYYNNVRSFKESEQFEQLVVLNQLGQKNNLKLKSKEILDLTLKNFVKDFDYSQIEREFKKGRIGFQWFQAQMSDDAEIPPMYKKKFRDHLKRYLNRQSWINNLTKIDWQII